MISFVCKDECVYENHYDYSVYLVYVHEPYIVALSDWEHLFFGFQKQLQLFLKAKKQLSANSHTLALVVMFAVFVVSTPGCEVGTWSRN